MLAALRSPCLTQGPRAEALERRFAALLGRRRALALSSGTAALHAAVAALRLPPGSEVITSPLTFAATANVLVHAGLVPRFCDVDPASGVPSPERAEAAIGPRTSAILPVDYAGFPCDGEGFRRLARRRGLALVEDATHLLGGRQRGRPAGAWADIAAFSLHPSKAIAAGEGGVAVTDDPVLADRIGRFRDHGFERPPGRGSAARRDLGEPGLNYRLSEMHAALALAQLRRLGGFIHRRAALARRYLERLAALPWIDLPALPGRHGDRHAWHLFVVRLRLGGLRGGRERIVEELRRRGVGAQVHYRPVCDYRYYRRRWPRGRSTCPIARRFAGRCLSLPLFPALRESQQECVARAVERVLAARARR